MTHHGEPRLTERFRSVMAGVATPVSVVTALDGDLPHGTTVSAFASLSMSPPMVLVSLDSGSDLLDLIRRTRRFGVNVLGSAQSALALSFARKGTDKFVDVAWIADQGLPRLPGAPGWLACEVAELVAGGDHIIALGTVIDADTVDGAPLTYHGRLFGTHAPLQPEPAATVHIETRSEGRAS
ncbi:flavin reductase family protein [Klenkia brasiliensis]|uniref:NADH-FMN oxidoreductase RutF, flavin reductase (DIM6/NTAB) family n=1 Tax=Klenkia brasiliensis TaxID=333142 RepID=A0A1G7Z486_9ACTN|nr:flavin reductase family protein [Klenkia brasiliensis]SDH03582.1 NADH-FMN oxidoreductase RutF, flavin reductase (DIM6/NTAB) family [Klenkia brasiliensis]